ncbi:MAG: septal ring lytic transglycosylase RlpA family protein [Bacteroidaceae bacterium]|nr:septal ring lytic transglycosylase RlpA family protein [Bacteroidaceae bacterium]
MSESQILFTQQGNASYYADRFHGRRMANGQLYHRDSMTCAHLRYPLGTKLLVRNIVNGREVVVTVTDRGPYTRKFVIDLSRAAARQLDIIHYGFQPVEIFPFIAGRIPYKYEPSTERPELDLGYTMDVDLGPPVWQDDSIYWARHRLSRTAVVQAYRDSLETTLREDTTLRQAIIKKPAAKKKEAQPSKKK